VVAIKTAQVRQYLEREFGTFYKERLGLLRKFQLNDGLLSINPYLFQSKDILLTQDFVRIMLHTHLSPQEEPMFGNLFVGLAIFVNQIVYNGWKSSTQGIDLEFNKNNVRYMVAIKSGPNWGNSSQIRRMRDDFRRAKQTLRTGNSKLHVVAVNGCCYGRNTKPDRGDYYKYCGQRFWEFISGNPDLYLKIIKPLGYSAREKSAEFEEAFAQTINRFTIELSEKFVVDGEIDWDALVKFNSAESRLK